MSTSKKIVKAKRQVPAKPMLGAAEKNLKIKELIKLAKEQGYLTYGDLNETLPENILTAEELDEIMICLLYTSPSPRDGLLSRMPSSA